MGVVRLRASGEGRTNTEYSKLIRRVLLVCVFVAAAITGGDALPADAVQAGQATAGPQEVRYLCASKSSGLLRYVTGPGKCSTGESSLKLPDDGPIYACASGQGVRRVADLRQCQSWELKLTLPGEKAVHFCAAKIVGYLRYVTGPGQCNSNEIAVVVPPANRAPVADDDSYEVDEDQTRNVAAPGVLDGDTDAEGDQLRAVKASDPAHGQLTLNPDGSFSYKPNANFNGSDSFTYKANDGKADGNTATVRITVKAVEDKPAAADDSYGVDEEKTLTVNDGPNDVLANDTDGDGDTLTAALVNAPGKGQLTLNPDGSFAYEPDENFNGSDSFTYKANDGKADGNEATVSITVNAVNDAPALTLTGGPDASEVDEGDATYAYEFTVADGDPGDDFTVKDGFPDCGEGGELVENSLSKTATGGSFQCRFVDGPSSPTVRMQVSDGDADSDIAEAGPVTVKNVKPTVELGGPGTVEESTTAQRTYTFTVADPGNDSFEVERNFPTCGDNGTPVENSLATDASGGSFKCIFPDGNNTSDVAIKVKDSDGLSDTDNKVVKVTVDNEAPTATFNAPDSVGEGEDVEISLTDATDPAGNNDTIEYRFKCGDDPYTDYGTVTTHVCPTTDDGEVVVKGQVRDEDGGEKEYQKTVTVENAKPSVTAAADQSADEGEEKGFKLGSFADPGSDGAWTITVDWGDDSEDTTFTANSPGDLPDGNHAYADDGVYTVTVTVAEDGTDAPSGSATFKVTVANLAPTATAQPVETQDGVPKTITLAGSDPGSDDLSFEITTLPDHGKLYKGQSTAAADEIASGNLPYALSGNEVTYAPDGGYDGPDAFDFKADDGTEKSAAATVSITVTEFNDPPVADDDSATTAEDTPVTIDVKDGDSPGAANESGQTLTVSRITTDPAHGTATVIDNGADAGKVRYAPAADYNGPDSFEYEVCDDGTTNRAPDHKCDTAIVNVTVTPVNDKPAAVDDPYDVDEDGTLTVSASDPPAGPAPGVLGNDTDVDDGDTLSVVDADGDAQGIQPVSRPAHGTLTLEADGSFVYEPDANYFGDDTFTYKANDRTVDSDAATVTITVNPVNDPPNAVDDDATTDEDKDLVVDVLDNDEIAPDTGETLTIQSVQDARHSMVSIDDGKVLYKPDANYYGDDSFTYTISDGNGGTDTATVNVTVDSVNDNPVGVADSYQGAIGNTRFSVQVSNLGGTGPVVTAPQGSLDVINNDTDADNSDHDASVQDTLTADTAPIETASGGSVTMNADGSFVYLPGPGFEGTGQNADSFTYTVKDDKGGTGTGTAKMDVTQMVWYVNNVASSNGDGRSDRPFNGLAPLTTGGSSNTLDEPGDHIFVYTGNASYGGGIVLEDNQKLIGQGVDLVVSGKTLVNAGSRPTITNASGDGVTLAQSNTVRGLNVSGTSGSGIKGTNINNANIQTPRSRTPWAPR